MGEHAASNFEGKQSSEEIGNRMRPPEKARLFARWKWKRWYGSPIGFA